MDGLDMYKGREINRRPDPEMGITKLANMKRQLKRAKKISMIAEGQVLAQSMSTIRNKAK